MASQGEEPAHNSQPVDPAAAKERRLAAQREQIRQKHLERVEEVKRAEAPILEDLLRAGVRVEHVQDLSPDRQGLVNEAVPVLLRWLPRVSEPSLKATLAEVLGVEQAKEVALQPLIRAFREWSGAAMARDAIGFAIGRVGDDAAFDQIADLVSNTQYGGSRTGLLDAIARMQIPRAVQLLIDLLQDPDLAPKAITVLGKRRVVRALPLITPFLQDPRDWVRGDARRAVARLTQPEARRRAPQRAQEPEPAREAGLEEWSTSLDVGALERVLMVLAECTEAGFGGNRVRDALAAFDQTKVGEECRICFPIKFRSRRHDVVLIVAPARDERSYLMRMKAEPEFIREVAPKIIGALSAGR